MKWIFIGFLLYTHLLADEYFATLEPINTYTYKASTSGEVLYANHKAEGTLVKDDVIIKLDKKLSQIELTQTIDKIKILEQMIEIENKNYERFKDLSSKSEFEKDTQKMKVLNLELQRNDLLSKKASLEDTIDAKTIGVKERFISTIFVKENDFVNAGTALFEAKDLSRGKLEIYIPIEKVDGYKKSQIYLDGKPTRLKINKVYKVADPKYISSYKCEIVLANPKKFSQLMKIEFR